MPWTRSSPSYKWVRKWCQSSGWTCQGTSKSSQLHSWNTFCWTTSLNWSVTASMVGCLSGWKEAKKLEVMEASRSLPKASTSRLRVMSFFSLWKLKGSQPAITSSKQVACLEEESADEEKYINSDGQDSIEGITKEFIVCLARAVKLLNRQRHAVMTGSPDHFICDCPLLAGAWADPPLNWREGMAPRKEAQAPQGKVTMLKVSQDGTPQT